MDTKTFLENFGTIAEAPGGINQLRSTVIELAVRGRLSSPTESDSPISELLTDIEKSGKISSSNRLAALAEPLWEIPSTWEWVRFKDIANFETGKTPPTKDPTMWADGDGYAWATIADLVAGEILTTTTKRVSEKAVADSMKRDPSPVGTMLMSFKLTIGKVARLGIPAYFNEAIIAIEVVDRDTDEYLFRTLPLLSQSATSKGAIKGSTLNASSLSNMMIPLPPLAEQKRIVAKVDELMALCDELEEKQQRKATVTTKLRGSAFNALRQAETPGDLVAAWERISTNWPHLTNHPDSVPELRKTILDLAVWGRLGTQDHRDPDAAELLEALGVPASESSWDLPPSWVVARMGDLHKKMGAGSTPRGGKNVYVELGVLFLRSQNVWNGGLEIEGAARIPLEVHAQMSGTEVHPDDVLLNITGASIGRSCIVPSDFAESANVSQHVAILRQLDKQLGPWIHMFLISPTGFHRIMSEQVGISREGLSMRSLKEFSVQIPPLAEQKRIVAKVDELMAMCDELEKQLQYQQDLSSRLAIASTRLAG
jgi:type I restriction enzyme S subunit